MAPNPRPAAREYEVHATLARAGDLPRVLKHDDAFAVLDDAGNATGREAGLFFRDTRHLSRLTLALDGAGLMLLSSGSVEDGLSRTVDLTNLDLLVDSALVAPFGTLHIERTQLIWAATLHERLQVTTFGDQTLAVVLRYEVEADFVDIFEVRGMTRAARGTLHLPELSSDGLTLRYDGLDGVSRSTTVRAEPVPALLDTGVLEFQLEITPGQAEMIEFSIACDAARPTLTFVEASDAAANTRNRLRAGYCQVKTSNAQFNGWLERSYTDLQTLTTELPDGLYPYAGIPWYASVYGRDGLITALQTLWVNPDIARGVLSVLARNQGVASVPERVEEPGKIPHELRLGEMGRLGEVPFGRYYGSADATPLFVLLAGRYYQATADLPFMRQLWPNLEAALAWIDDYGDPDGDGFVEYLTSAERGLTNQGWKDSWDSVFHAAGAIAAGPIALVEVQAYVYGAKRLVARVAEALGHRARAAALHRQATELRRRFDQAFWCDAIQTYALALDGEKRQCAVRSSNAGHALFTGLAKPARAPLVTAQLLSEDGFSGWGPRTIARGEARYNPMAYHNGSIWPHDTAMIAAGLADYGFVDGALAVLNGLFWASLHLDLQRLPELFCGFERRTGDGPTLYPLACSPQAWASGSAFMALQAVLGISLDAPAQLVRIRNPHLPPYLAEVELSGLRVGTAEVDLTLRRTGDETEVTVTRPAGDVRVELGR